MPTTTVTLENKHGQMTLKKNRRGRVRLRRRRVGKTEKLVKRIYGNNGKG